VRGLADEPVADAGLFRPLHGERRGLHRRHRTKTVIPIHDEYRGAILDKARLHLHVDLAALDIFQIARQPRYAVAVDAAQIGPDQAIGNGIGIDIARAGDDEHVVDEALQLLVADDNLAATLIAAHARLAGK
jgi:hypothetical protein